MIKSYKLSGFSLACIILLLLTVLLAACGEETPTSDTSVTPTPTVPVPTATVTAAPTPTPTPTPEPTRAAVTVPANTTPVVGDLPVPAQSRKLNLTLDMLQRLQKRLGGQPAATDLSSLAVGAYAMNGQPVDALDFYRAVMPAKGWTETHRYDNRFGIYFEKGDRVAIASAVGIPDESTVTFLAGFIPEVKGQVKGGEVLVLLGQGDSSVFELLKK